VVTICIYTYYFPFSECATYSIYFLRLSVNNGFYPRDVVSAVLATATSLAGWLAGWVYDTRPYCIKTAKPILKLFRPTGSPIILVSSDTCADTKFQSFIPLARAINTRGGEMGDFRRKSPFISETVRDMAMVTMDAGLHGIIFDDLE